MPKTAPPLWSADRYAETFGLKRPSVAGKTDTKKAGKAAAAAGGGPASDPAAAHCDSQAASSSSASTIAVTVAEDGSKLTKNQKKKAKKREKKAAAAAAAGAGAEPWPEEGSLALHLLQRHSNWLQAWQGLRSSEWCYQARLTRQ